MIANQAFAQYKRETELKTSISDVTVFLNGAQLTRTGNVSIKPGQTVIIAKGLSPFVNERSIQICEHCIKDSIIQEILSSEGRAYDL